MKDEDFNSYFEGVDFDLEEPHTGHRDRFAGKLEKNTETAEKGSKLRRLWAPVLGIAASFALAFILLGEITLPLGIAGNSDLASISPEMRQTQEFYTSLISKELNALNAEKSPETEAIITDALRQMEKLENNYEMLKDDLKDSGNDNRVIFAMIQNFQQRIDLLKNVLTQIENKKTLKNQNHESNII